MLYVLEVKTENVEDYLALRDVISDFMDSEPKHESHRTKNPATEGSGDPYYFRPRQINSTRPLKNTATPPNRNIEEED